MDELDIEIPLLSYGIERIVSKRPLGKVARKTHNRGLLNAIELNPSQVLFTQSTINIFFSNGTPILHTLHDIALGFLPKAELPMIRVWKDGGRWFTLDNRRLWVLKTAGISSVMMENANMIPSLELEYSSKRCGKPISSLRNVSFTCDPGIGIKGEFYRIYNDEEDALGTFKKALKNFIHYLRDKNASEK